MTATKKLSRCPTDTLNHTALKVLILSKMYRHDLNYMCGFSRDWKRFVESHATLMMTNVLNRRVLKWDAQPLI